MEKSLIIGLDLSFSCTGICISYLEQNIGKSISFHKIVFDDNSNKTGKAYVPTPIKNVNTITYRLPTNLLVDDLSLDLNDINTTEQSEITLKALIASKKIHQIISQKVNEFKPDCIYISIENYIMPQYTGPAQLKTVSGLITLQSYVRKNCIELALSLKIPIKLFTPTPSSNKLFFTKDGNADKLKMLQFFINHYDGKKLLPSVTINDVAKINDVIDAFSLMMFTYSKIINNNNK